MTSLPGEAKLRQLASDETPQSIARAGYDHAAQAYLDWTNSLPDNPRLIWLNKALSHLPSQRPTGNQASQPGSSLPTHTTTALDLGCGAGTPSTIHLAQTLDHVTGIDISGAQISLARSHFAAASPAIPASKFTLLECDIMEAQFPPKSFTLITAFYSVMHLNLVDQRTLLSRCAKWLKPGGVLLFNVGEASSASDSKIAKGLGGKDALFSKGDDDGGQVQDGWLGMPAAYWANWGMDRIIKIVDEEVGLEVLESEVVRAESDADFVWIIARKRDSDS